MPPSYCSRCCCRVYHGICSGCGNKSAARLDREACELAEKKRAMGPHPKLKLLGYDRHGVPVLSGCDPSLVVPGFNPYV